MTRTSKQAIRTRMAVSGKPYSVAARQLAGFEAGGGALAAEVGACARVTAAEPGARVRQAIGPSVEVELRDFGIPVAHLDWARFP